MIKIFILKISKKMLNQTVCFQNPVCFQIPLDVQPDERNGLRTPIWSVRALTFSKRLVTGEKEVFKRKFV